MKLKNIILLFILILVTGCSAEYNLVINKDKTIDESIIVLQPNSFWGSNQNEINEQLDWTLVFSKDETEPAYFYNQEKILGSVNSGVKYQYGFSSNEFLKQSDIIKNCFDNYNLEFNNYNIIDIYASGFKCFSALGDNFDLDINIIIDGEVLEGNYDKKNNNRYTWSIDQKEDFTLQLKVNTEDLEAIEKENETAVFSGIIIAIIIGGLLLCAFLVAYIKNKSNNS